LPTDADFQFKEPKFRKKKFIFHPFKRAADDSCIPDPTEAPVEVTIPEQLAASYGLYIWPSSPVLAWYLWLNQDKVKGKRVLELGAGTALPGLLVAKLGCKVTLTDDVSLSHCLENCREATRLNGLESEVAVQGLSWGFFTKDTLGLKNSLDLVIGSDLFFDPVVFEPLLVTIRYRYGRIFCCH
jgi:predicted nicotinamide N-methyase